MCTHMYMCVCVCVCISVMMSKRYAMHQVILETCMFICTLIAVNDDDGMCSDSIITAFGMPLLSS